MVYGDFNGPGQRKNKANSNPNEAKQSQFMLAPSTAVGLKKTQNNEKNR